MELKAENVKNIRSLSVCKEFLRQAIEQNEELRWRKCAEEMLEECCHHKYKRCLTMSWYCESLMREAFLGNPEYIEWLEKWRERWLKIAEQFKEAK